MGGCFLYVCEINGVNAVHIFDITARVEGPFYWFAAANFYFIRVVISGLFFDFPEITDVRQARFSTLMERLYFLQ